VIDINGSNAQQHTELETQPSVLKLFVKNIFAAMVAVVVSGVYVITDGMFVGQYVGKEGLAAVGIAYPIYMLLPAFGLMLGIGGGALMSMHRGAGQLGLSRQACIASLQLILLASLFCWIFLGLFSPWLLSVQSAPWPLIVMAQEYLDVFQYGAVSAIGAGTLTLLIRNDGSPNIAMFIMIFGALLNIALNYYFLAILDFEIAGAAYATVISMSSVCVVSGMYFLSASAKINLSTGLCAFNYKMCLTILLTGSSVFAMYLYSGFVIAVHNKLFASYGNSSSLSAFAIVGYLMSIYYMLAEGIGDGVQPLLSYFHGQKRADKNRQLMQLSVSVVLLLGVFSYGLVNLVPSFFIHLFNSDPEVAIKATTGLKYHLAALYLDGVIVMATVYFMASGRGLLALLISIVNMVIQLPFLYLLPLYFGEFAIWLALPISNVVMFIWIAPMLWRDIQTRSAHSSISTTVVG